MRNTSMLSQISAIFRGQDQDYDTWMFVLLAGCFMVAVPVTISGTIIMRLVSTYTQLYKLFWRYFGVIAAPLVLSTYSYSMYSSETSGYAAYLFINDIYFMIVASQGYRQALRNPTTTRKWLTFGLVALVCCVVDNTIHLYMNEVPLKSHAVMIFPWAFLLLHWRSKLRGHNTTASHTQTAVSNDVKVSGD